MIKLGKNTQKLWTKEFTQLSIANLALLGSIYLLLPILPKFAAAELGANEMMIGWAIGFTSLSAILARPLGGYLLDIYNKKTVYLLLLAGVVLVMLSYNLVATLLLLFVIRIVHGLFAGPAVACGLTVVGGIIPPARRGEGVGFYGISSTIALAVGPLIGLTVLGGNSYGRVFMVSTFLAVAALLLALTVRFPKSEPVKRRLTWGAVIEFKVLPLSLLILISSFAFSGVLSFIALYCDKEGISNGSGPFFLVYASILALSRPFSGRLFDKKGPKTIVTMGFVFLLIGYLVLSQWKSIPGLLCAAALIALGNGFIQPTLFAMGLNVIPRDRYGAGNATVYSSMDIGNAGGAIILGWIASVTSLSFIYLLCGILMVVPFIYFRLFAYKHYRKLAEENSEIV